MEHVRQQKKIIYHVSDSIHEDLPITAVLSTDAVSNDKLAWDVSLPDCITMLYGLLNATPAALHLSDD